MNEAISASSSVLSCGVSSVVGRFASLMGHLVGHPPAFVFSGFAASFVVAVPPVPFKPKLKIEQILRPETRGEIANSVLACCCSSLCVGFDQQSGRQPL